MRKALLTAGLAGALTLSAGSAAVAARVAADDAASMHDRMSGQGTGSMMGSSIDAGDMAAMHDSMSGPAMDDMHDQMAGAMPAEVRETCDRAHAAMKTTSGGAPGSSAGVTPFGHATHHDDR